MPASDRTKPLPFRGMFVLRPDVLEVYSDQMGWSTCVFQRDPEPPSLLSIVPGDTDAGLWQRFLIQVF